MSVVLGMASNQNVEKVAHFLKKNPQKMVYFSTVW